jgi:hypothetical protein
MYVFSDVGAWAAEWNGRNRLTGSRVLAYAMKFCKAVRSSLSLRTISHLLARLIKAFCGTVGKLYNGKRLLLAMLQYITPLVYVTVQPAAFLLH